MSNPFLLDLGRQSLKDEILVNPNLVLTISTVIYWWL